MTAPVDYAQPHVRAVQHALDAPADPTDIEYVAIAIDRLRHLDLGKIVDDMFGDTMPTDRAACMTKMAEWAVKSVPEK